MRAALTGLRGRITFSVLAVTAVVFSALATVGFVRIAAGGRDAIEERTAAVADELVAVVERGGVAREISTADGVTASVVTAGEAASVERDGEVLVTRRAEAPRGSVTVVARSSEAPLTDSLRSLYRVLWVGVPLAALVSALLAGLATRRALRPVDDITARAAAVGADPDGVRVPEPGTGDEIDRLAVTVNGMLDRIESGHRAQRRFTSDAAHELRTPLMALHGEVELLARAPGDLDPATLDRLDELCHRLGARIDDLVLLATMDEGRPLRSRPVDLGALAAEEAAAFGAMVDVAADEGVVVAVDADLVARAVRNLVANAVRHARNRVTVTVEVDGGGRAWVHVDDDGPGIPADERDAVFARFGRRDEARAAGEGGAGLGLAIVASVASAHGGGTAVAASPLGGARVSLWVPAGEAPA